MSSRTSLLNWPLSPTVVRCRGGAAGCQEGEAEAVDLAGDGAASTEEASLIGDGGLLLFRHEARRTDCQ
jgi:hypothetical protein